MPSLTLDTACLDAHPGVGVVVGFSGGLDSAALLHALARRDDIRRRGLRAVHVNHGLQPDADRWAAHCAAFCERLDVAFDAVNVEVTAAGRGPEAAARDARHAALSDAAGAGGVVALAHHRDDQAETFLLRALRASGPDGLGAMRAWRACGDVWLWRPLLAVPRSTLEAYARRHALAWIDDPSNHDPAFDRNFLRLSVLPLLRERWPHADAALAAAAAHTADAARLLESEDARLLAAMQRSDATLDVDPLRVLDPARRARVLRRWIETLGLPPLPAAGVARIEREILDARHDANPEFAWHGARVRRWTGLLHAGPITPPLPEGWSARWSGHDTLQLPDGGELALDAPRSFPEPLTVRPRRGGERIRLAGREHRHALKHVLQALRVPPWERDHLPLLFAPDGELLAAGDIALAARFQCWLQGEGVALVWRRPPATPQR